MRNATVIMLVVGLALAAPAFGTDYVGYNPISGTVDIGQEARIGQNSGAGEIDVLAGGSFTCTGGRIGEDNDATLSVQVGGSTSWNGETEMPEGGAYTTRLNVYGTAYIEQLKIYGTGDDSIAVVGNGTDAATLTVVESLLGNDGVASITINAGSTMLVAGDWDWAFEIGANGTVALADGGVLKVNAIDVHFATQEAKVTGDWVKTFDAGAFGGDGANVYTGVPEPATMSLLALGGLAMLRRRRKR